VLRARLAVPWDAPLLADVAGAYRILRTTRPASLYAGLAPSLAAVVPTAVVYMPTYELAAAALADAACVPAACVAPLAGVLTGVVCAAVRVPASVVKSRVQLGLAPGAWAAATTALRAGGPRALYVGFSATVALDVAVAVVQFSALDVGRARTTMSNAMLGFVASALACAATEPIDVVRTRIMAQLRVGESRGRAFGYAGLRDGMAKAARTEGVAALYRGLLPRLLLKSCGGAIWYSTYVACKDLFLDLG
jgi:solute carrier family 25 S-adenosylmethionine transporter 26